MILWGIFYLKKKRNIYLHLFGTNNSLQIEEVLLFMIFKKNERKKSIRGNIYG